MANGNGITPFDVGLRREAALDGIRANSGVAPDQMGTQAPPPGQADSLAPSGGNPVADLLAQLQTLIVARAGEGHLEDDLEAVLAFTQSLGSLGGMQQQPPEASQAPMGAGAPAGGPPLAGPPPLPPAPLV